MEGEGEGVPCGCWDALVVGSGIFKSEDPVNQINKFKDLAIL